MVALKKFWSFLKTHWYIPVIIIAALIFRSKGKQFSEILEASQESHKKQIKAIEDAEVEKQKRKKEIEDEYENVIKELDKNYSKENKILDKREKKYVKYLVDSWADDPGQMAERIRMRFGFNYVPKTNDSDTD